MCAIPRPGASTGRDEPGIGFDLRQSRRIHMFDSAHWSKQFGVTMKGFVRDIESLAVGNEEFRRVLYTARHCQLVVMALKPGEEIGAEVHKLDQFFRVEEGTGEAILDGVRTPIRAGFAVVVPAGAQFSRDPR